VGSYAAQRRPGRHRPPVPVCGSGMRSTHCGNLLSSGGQLPVPPALWPVGRHACFYSASIW